MNPRQQRSLSMQSIGLALALVVQYALGMYVNLFVAFPENATEGQLWEFAWSQKMLAGHIILAFLILFGAIVLAIRAAMSKNKRWVIASGLGLLAILAAGQSGATFIPSQAELYSYFMSLAFLVAILSYLWGAYGHEHKEIV